MSTDQHTTFYNYINSLGYLLTLPVVINALLGWVPIFFCFRWYETSIGWNEGWIGRWAFLELLFYVAAVLLAMTLRAARLDLRNLPAGWHFLWLFSTWRNTDEEIHFGRHAAAGHTQEEHVMSDDEKKDYPARRTRPDRYSAVRPSTSVTGKKVTISNIIPTLVDSKMEQLREKFEKREVEEQIETLRKKKEANVAYSDYISSDVDAENAEQLALERNALQGRRNLREAAEIERDIENIRNPPKDPPPKPKRTYAEEVAEKLRRGAMGKHAGEAEQEIKKDAAQWGGEEKAPEERKALYRQIREEAAQKDEGRG